MVPRSGRLTLRAQLREESDDGPRSTWGRLSTESRIIQLQDTNEALREPDRPARGSPTQGPASTTNPVAANGRVGGPLEQQKPQQSINQSIARFVRRKLLTGNVGASLGIDSGPSLLEDEQEVPHFMREETGRYGPETGHNT